MMKKTLVALAAVAVTGGAFAQATMTGAVSLGYSSDTTVAGVNTSGFGVNDSEINFSVSEAIDGVGNLTAGLGFGGGGNGAAVTSNDMNITMALSSGTKLKFYGGKSADYLSGGLAGAGANFELASTAIFWVHARSKTHCPSRFLYSKALPLDLNTQSPARAALELVPL